MQKRQTTTEPAPSAPAASPKSPASPRSWRTALSRVRPALHAVWFVGLLAATALAGAAPGVIDVR